ncbi:hypothetical protein [Paenibacillus tarimensis]|uniref:hypothetical protein n=1 Tax=Paenibacillus tarimensis TaxID=416012 RepID=UPI001F2EF043|nr:hypothetical protein [Paenibacillus tarimensis]MCF2944367.1 hypothetical protein [Paenibacillus tarimensis]
MNTKISVISLYLVIIYWLSMHVPMLKPLFYPTLGTLSYVLATRQLTIRESASIMTGAVAASLLGTGFHYWLPETVAILATFLLSVLMIQRFRLNAPPILAIALISYFAPPTLRAPFSLTINLPSSNP